MNNQKRGFESSRDETKRNIELTIFHLGDKHPSMTPEEDLDATVKMVMEERKEYSAEIISGITACLLELAHKMPHYCSLVASLNRDDPVLVAKILVDFADTLNRSIAVGNWRHLVQGVRTIIELECRGVISSESVNQLLAVLAKKADVPFVRWLLLANLPFTSEGAAHFEALKSHSSNSDFADLADLIALNANLNGTCIGRDNAASNPNAHHLMPLDFDVLTVDPAWDGNFQYMTIFADTFEPDVGPSGKFVQWWTVLHLRMLMETMEMNHPKLAETLLAVPAESVGHPEKIVAEFLFGELLRVRHNNFRQVLYEVVLMGCCRITRLFPPVMARALLALTARIETLDLIQRDKLADWFAHHLSNFDFKWKWDEWADVVDLPKADSKRLFVQSVLERLLHLSYYDRVLESIPEWAKCLLPPIPSPFFESAEDPLAKQVLEAIQTRASVDDLRGILSSSGSAPSIFVQCLLSAGSKTISHTVILVERYLPILQSFHPKGDLDSRIQTIRTIRSFWRTSTQHFAFILERLLHYRILTAQSVLSWAFQTASSQLTAETADAVLLGVLDWDIISTTLKQSRGFPDTIAARLAACPDEDVEQRTKLSHTLQALRQEHADTLALAREGLSNLSARCKPEVASVAASVSADMLKYIDSL